MMSSDENNMKRSETGLLETILAEADDLDQKGETRKAVEQLAAALPIAPGNSAIYQRITEILLDAKCFTEALETVRNAVNAGNHDSKTRLLQAYCLEGLGQIPETTAIVDECLRHEPGNALALNLKGIISYKNGDRAVAEDHFTKAIDADRSYGEPCTNIGVMRWAAGQHAEGLEFIERGFVLSPCAADIAAAYHSAITAEAAFSRAEKTFREALRVHPHNKRIDFLLIDVLLQQEKFTDAMNEVEHAMTLFGIDDGILSAALDIRSKIGPLAIGKETRPKTTVSLCMIVKNEEQHLGACLMSAKPVVDEMIVVDTGSNDRTRDIAAAFGAMVYDFPWANDFSTARNVSLSKASGDWIFVLDADEVVAQSDHSELRRLMSTTGRKTAYSFVTRNYIPQINKTGWTANDGAYEEEAGAGWFGSSKVRLFPRDDRVRFVNPVHELVEPSLVAVGIDIQECAVPIHHYGKLDQTKVTAKWEEYYLLGRKKLDEQGENADALRELAIQAGELKRFDEAVELWQRAIRLQPRMVIAYINLASVHLQKDEFDNALAAGKKAMDISPASSEVISNYALCELYAGSADRSMAALRGLLKVNPSYSSAAIVLAVACICSGNKEEGTGVFARLGILGPARAECLLPFARKLIRAGREAQANILIDAAFDADPGNNEIKALRSARTNTVSDEVAAGEA